MESKIFISFLRDRLKDTQGNINEYSHLSINAMVFLIIDTLSKAIHPKMNKNNSKRFQLFIEQYANWKDSERTSLPHIARLIEIIPDAFDIKLRDWIKTKISEWGYNAYVNVSNDPMISEIPDLWPKTLPEPFKRFKLKMFQHRSLIYGFRNDLIHELKMSGDGHESGKTNPYYYLTHVGPSFKSKAYWRLYYPPGFMLKIAENSITAVEEYYKLTKKNPFDSFDYGIFMFPELNKYTKETDFAKIS